MKESLKEGIFSFIAMILIIAMIMLFVYSLNKAYNEEISAKINKTLEEGQYIEYADNVFKVISISDDKEYIIVDTLSKTFPLRLLKVTNYIKPVDAEIVEKYLELSK